MFKWLPILSYLTYSSHGVHRDDATGNPETRISVSSGGPQTARRNISNPRLFSDCLFNQFLYLLFLSTPIVWVRHGVWCQWSVIAICSFSPSVQVFMSALGIVLILHRMDDHTDITVSWMMGFGTWMWIPLFEHFVYQIWLARVCYVQEWLLQTGSSHCGLRVSICHIQPWNEVCNHVRYCCIDIWIRFSILVIHWLTSAEVLCFHSFVTSFNCIFAVCCEHRCIMRSFCVCRFWCYMSNSPL